MDGEFLCEETFGTVKGVAGGNIILMGTEPAATLAAAESAVAAMRRCPDVILPFPGRHRSLGIEGRQQVQETPRQHQHGLCPHAPRRGRDRDARRARCAYEIVIDGLSLEAVERATAAGLHAAKQHETNLVAITSGNYGGKLGPVPYPAS